jgi:hypothetical protein
MSGEIPSLVDLQNTKVRIDHFAELIDGTPSGTSTNPITGVTHPTYEKAIKDLGFKPASFTFVTGGTLGVADTDKCIYNPAPAGDDNWYSWGGALPHTVAPGTDPTSVNGYVPRSDVVLRSQLASNTGGSLIGLTSGETVQQFVSGKTKWYKTLSAMLADTSLDIGDTAACSGTTDVAAIFDIVASATPDNIDIYAIANGLFARRKASVSGDEFYSHKQRVIFGQKQKKFRESGTVSVAWYGDSNSVRDGGKVKLSFIDSLVKAYGAGKAAISSDRATSGFSAKTLYQTYTDPHVADITIINCGTNDATTQAGYPLDSNINEYEYWLERLIIRELNWGNPVVLVTPLPLRIDKSFETYAWQPVTDLYPTMRRVDSYMMSAVMKYLGAKYSIPVVDSDEIIAPFFDEAYADATASISGLAAFGDVVHLDTAYLAVWGNGIACSLIGNLMGLKPVAVIGTKFTVRKYHDPIAISSSRNFNQLMSYDPLGTNRSMAYGDWHVGRRSLNIIAGERVTWAFYLQADNAVIFPAIVVPAGSIAKVRIDNGNLVAPVALDYALDNGASSGDDTVELTISPSTKPAVNREPSPKQIDTTVNELNRYMRLHSRGWHSITVKCTQGNVYVSGISFAGDDAAMLADSLVSAKTDVSITLVGNGRMLYAPPGSVGIPAEETSGFFDKAVTRDDQTGIIRFYGATGKAYTLQKTAGSWGSWVQI